MTCSAGSKNFLIPCDTDLEIGCQSQAKQIIKKKAFRERTKKNNVTPRIHETNTIEENCSMETLRAGKRKRGMNYFNFGPFKGVPASGALNLLGLGESSFGVMERGGSRRPTPVHGPAATRRR